MLIKLKTPGGQIEKVRIENIQYYLNRGYKRIIEPEILETVELMSPAGKVVVDKKDMNDYLQREGWGLLVEKVPTDDETPEPPVENETPEEPEKPVEDETPVLPTDETPVEEPESTLVEEPEPEIVEADTETTDDIPEGAEEADAETEGQFQRKRNGNSPPQQRRIEFSVSACNNFNLYNRGKNDSYFYS